MSLVNSMQWIRSKDSIWINEIEKIEGSEGSEAGGQIDGLVMDGDNGFGKSV